MKQTSVLVLILRATVRTPTSSDNLFCNSLILVRVPDVTEMTSNPHQLQSQLVVEQDAAVSWDALREVSFFLVSMGGQSQYVTNTHNENQFSRNLTPVVPLQTVQANENS